MNYEELQQKVKRLEEELTEVRIALLESKADKKSYEVRMPDDIRNYYYADEIGEIYVVGNIISIDAYKEIYQRGITFETEREVKQYERERILLFKLHKWAEEHNGGWTHNLKDLDEEGKYIIRYDYEDNQFTYVYSYCHNDFSKLPIFNSEELAEQFIEEFGDEIKEVLC
jgi:hypothetical protein|nr:MAG TPA: hypothetical protein [Caudoviricetes sp.]